MLRHQVRASVSATRVIGERVGGTGARASKSEIDGWSRGAMGPSSRPSAVIGTRYAPTAWGGRCIRVASSSLRVVMLGREMTFSEGLRVAGRTRIDDVRRIRDRCFFCGVCTSALLIGKRQSTSPNTRPGPRFPDGKLIDSARAAYLYSFLENLALGYAIWLIMGNR